MRLITQIGEPTPKEMREHLETYCRQGIHVQRHEPDFETANGRFHLLVCAICHRVKGWWSHRERRIVERWAEVTGKS